MLRGFHDVHRDAGSGPLLSRFPVDRSRRGGRAHAHHNPMEPHRSDRAGRYRPSVPTRIPRAVPDDEFNEIFARLPSHRERALVALFVSTRARASELLSVTLGGVDPGRQLIRVIRKGSGAAQGLLASSDAFVWLRLYQVEMADLIPSRRRHPLWWTLRRPPGPLTYHGARRMFERVNQSVGTTATLHSPRHILAAYLWVAIGFAMTIVEAAAVTGGVNSRDDRYLAAAIDDVGVGGLLGVGEFPAQPTGAQALLDWPAAFGPLRVVGIDSPGGCGGWLARHLGRAGVAVADLGPPRGRPGGDETVAGDAVGTARAARTGQGRLLPAGSIRWPRRSGCSWWPVGLRKPSAPRHSARFGCWWRPAPTTRSACWPPPMTPWAPDAGEGD